jgi:hypothetical protein
MTKGQGVDCPIPGKMSSHCPLLFLHKSETGMPGTTGVTWIAPICLVLVMQRSDYHTILVVNPYVPFG